MKRFLLLVLGFVAALTSVLFITPPRMAEKEQAIGGDSKVIDGPVITTDYGDIQVEIVVSNKKIVDAKAIQAPGGSNQTYTDLAVPKLREETLAAQSANIQAVSGASGLSAGWKASLASAIAQAGI
jgi:uncharacterized protein with FMN-binding domain